MPKEIKKVFLNRKLEIIKPTKKKCIENKEG